jgi:hypothetical protein
VRWKKKQYFRKRFGKSAFGFLQNRKKRYRMKKYLPAGREEMCNSSWWKKGRRTMNFYNKKFRKIASVIIIVIIVAMILTGVVPYLF